MCASQQRSPGARTAAAQLQAQEAAGQRCRHGLVTCSERHRKPNGEKNPSTKAARSDSREPPSRPSAARFLEALLSPPENAGRSPPALGPGGRVRGPPERSGRAARGHYRGRLGRNAAAPTGGSAPPERTARSEAPAPHRREGPLRVAAPGEAAAPGRAQRRLPPAGLRDAPPSGGGGGGGDGSGGGGRGAPAGLRGRARTPPPRPSPTPSRRVPAGQSRGAGHSPPRSRRGCVPPHHFRGRAVSWQRDVTRRARRHTHGEDRGRRRLPHSPRRG